MGEGCATWLHIGRKPTGKLRWCRTSNSPSYYRGTAYLVGEQRKLVYRASEPVDLTESTEIMTAKYNKFRELRSDLERWRARVLSLQESANQLLERERRNQSTPTGIATQIAVPSRLTGIYALKLGAALGMDPRDIGLTAATSFSCFPLFTIYSTKSCLLEPLSPTDAPGAEMVTMANVRYYLGDTVSWAEYCEYPCRSRRWCCCSSASASLVPSAKKTTTACCRTTYARSFTPNGRLSERGHLLSTW